MRMLFIAASMAALLSAGTVLAEDSKSLSVTVEGDTLKTITGDLKWDPRTQRFTVEVGDNKSVTVDTKSLDRVRHNAEAEWNRIKGRAIRIYEDAVKE